MAGAGGLSLGLAGRGSGKGASRGAGAWPLPGGGYVTMGAFGGWVAQS